MLWVQVKAAVESVVQSIALRQVDAGWKVEWFRGRHAFISPKTRAGIYLRIPVTRVVGSDEERPAAGSGLATARHGQREFTLEIQIVSYAPNDVATGTRAAFVDDAHEFAERIRTRIMRAGPRATLAAANTSVIRLGDVVETETVVDSRVQQVATLELFMRSGFVDETEADQDYFDHVELNWAGDLPELWISDELTNGFGVVQIASPRVWREGGTVDRILELDIPPSSDGGPGMNWTFDPYRRFAWTSSWRLGHEELFGFTPESVDGTQAPPAITVATSNESKTFLVFKGGDLWGLDRANTNSRLFRYDAGQIAVSSVPELAPSLDVTILCGTGNEATTSAWIWDDLDYIWICNWQISVNPNHGKQLLGLPPAQYAASGTVTPEVICQGSHWDGNPAGIVADPNGTHCWVSFWASGEIKRFSFAALRAGGNAAPDIVFTSPAFVNPWGLAMGPDNVLWVAGYSECKALGFNLARLTESGAFAPDRTIDVPAADSVYNLIFRPTGPGLAR